MSSTTAPGGGAFGRVVQHVIGVAAPYTGNPFFAIPKNSAEWQGRIGYTPDHFWTGDQALPLQPGIGIRTISVVIAGDENDLAPGPFATQRELKHGTGTSRLAVSGDTAFLEDSGATDIWYLTEGYFPNGNNTYLWYKSNAASAGVGYQLYRTPANAFVWNIDDGPGAINVTDPGWADADRAIMLFGYSQTNGIGYIVIAPHNGKIYSASSSIAALTASLVNGAYVISNAGNALGYQLSFLAGFIGALTLDQAVTVVKRLL
jgi:hypothetical protein